MNEVFRVTDNELRAMQDRAAGACARYPFHDMAVGDGFRVDAAHRDSAKVAAYNFARRHSIRFSTKREPDGLLIVRIA